MDNLERELKGNFGSQYDKNPRMFGLMTKDMWVNWQFNQFKKDNPKFFENDTK